MAQLKPVDSTEMSTSDEDILASAALAAMFVSLLGALAWLTQGRPDIAIFVVALQRHNKGPKIVHCKKCNRVLSYVRRKPMVFNFVAITGLPWRIVCVSDSAYKVEGEGETRAMVGHMILFMGTTPSEPASGMSVMAAPKAPVWSMLPY